jgi:hypothetical protein
MMQLVVVGLVVVPLVLKPKLKPHSISLVPLLLSLFRGLELFPSSTLLRTLLIKKDELLLMMCAP